MSLPPLPLRRQRGITLVMALIMLVVITLLALTSFNLGKSNLQIVSNMQQRDESIAAARGLLEEIISDTRFSDSPEASVANPCGPNQRCVDSNGDGVTDVRVTVKNPTCVKVQNIKTSELNWEKPKDEGCMIEGQTGTGPEGSNNGDSLCVNSVWEVEATAVDEMSQAKVVVTQGISVRVEKTATDSHCKI